MLLSTLRAPLLLSTLRNTNEKTALPKATQVHRPKDPGTRSKRAQTPSLSSEEDPVGDDEGAPSSEKLREQRALQFQLQQFALQLAKTQANLHRKPPIILPAINKVFLFPPEKPTPIQGYHGWNTEFEACQAFHRPPQKVPHRHTYLPLAPRPQS